MSNHIYRHGKATDRVRISRPPLEFAQRLHAMRDDGSRLSASGVVRLFRLLGADQGRPVEKDRRTYPYRQTARGKRGQAWGVAVVVVVASHCHGMSKGQPLLHIVGMKVRWILDY